MTEDDYRLIQQNFAKADAETKKEFIDKISAAFFDDLRVEARKMIGKDVGRISPTSVVILTYLRVLGFFTRSGNLENYKTLDELFRFFHRAVYSALIDKYRSECRRHGITLDDLTEPPSVSNEFVQDVMTQEIAQKLLDILGNFLTPEELELLIRRFAHGESYAQIAASVESHNTPDAVRMRIKRIQKRLLDEDDDDITILRDDYTQNNE